MVRSISVWGQMGQTQSSTLDDKRRGSNEEDADCVLGQSEQPWTKASMSQARDSLQRSPTTRQVSTAVSHGWPRNDYVATGLFPNASSKPKDCFKFHDESTFRPRFGCAFATTRFWPKAWWGGSKVGSLSSLRYPACAANADCSTITYRSRQGYRTVPDGSCPKSLMVS